VPKQTDVVTSNPPLSVIIPTYNRAERLRAVLAAVEAQTVGDDELEVIVVSDGSTDGTEALLRSAVSRFAFRYEVQPNGGPAVARNTGLALAAAPLVLFLDDDVIASPVLAAEHLAAHAKHGRRSVVIGPMMNPEDVTLRPWIAWEQAMLYKQYRAMIAGHWAPTARQFYTGNVSLGRQEAIDAGAFDPSFRRAEDVEFAYRLADSGFHFVFEPRAVGYHYADRSFESWLANATAYGRNDVIFARERGQGWLLRVIPEEFGHHHLLVRMVTRATLRWPRLRRPTTTVLRGVARGSSTLRLGAIAHRALSGVYNLAYYHGVADELGTEADLLALIDGARQRAKDGHGN
jgi:GT2 family glycosyltransferase